MNRAQIIAKKKEIACRFAQEARAFRSGMKEELSTPVGWQKLGMYYLEHYARLHHCILREIAGTLIRPYNDDPEKVIANFILYHNSLFEKKTLKKSRPKLHDFFKWYCDSDVIREEVTHERSWHHIVEELHIMLMEQT